MRNLPLYKRVIKNYEGNSLEVKDSVIYINKGRLFLYIQNELLLDDGR